MSNIVYLTVPLVIEIHKQQIDNFGGSHGVRDIGLVTAAVMRPQTGYYSDIFEEAAALWESLTGNHGFVDGNKRIGFAAMDVFLDINGYALDCQPEIAIDFILKHLEACTFYKDNLDSWLREHVQKV